MEPVRGADAGAGAVASAGAEAGCGGSVSVSEAEAEVAGTRTGSDRESCPGDSARAALVPFCGVGGVAGSPPA